MSSCGTRTYAGNGVGRLAPRAAVGACAVACLLSLALAGCATQWAWPPHPWPDASAGQSETAIDAQDPTQDAVTSQEPANDKSDATGMVAPTTDAASSVVPREWDEATAPNYYEVVGPAHIDKTLAPGTVEYAALDALGRAVQVRACVDAQLAEAGTSRERRDVSDLSPSGWGHNREVSIKLPTGNVYHGHFWNRSHLLAKSLGGDETIQNLVCGTRMQNVGTNVGGTEGGMAFPESLARTWLYEHTRGFVHYCVTPIYQGDEPVCRNVIVDVLSSDGTLDVEVVVYNAAKGYRIDYETGDFHEC